MFIRDSWGSCRQCRIGHRIGISHEIITNFSAPVFRDVLSPVTWSNIIIHISGDVNYTTAYNSYAADSLDIFTVDTNEAFLVDWGRTQVYERFCIYFDNGLFSDIYPIEADYKVALSFLNHKKTPNLIKLSDTYKDELTALLNEIEPKLGTNESDAVISVFASLMKLFDFVYRASNAATTVPSYSPDNIVAKAIQFIDLHYKEIAEVNTVAEELHVSAEYLSKKFKSSMGISLKSYLLDKKLHFSRRLLKLGYNVTEAANSAGFSSSSYFIQLYKKKYGVTPGKE